MRDAVGKVYNRILLQKKRELSQYSINWPKDCTNHWDRAVRVVVIRLGAQSAMSTNLHRSTVVLAGAVVALIFTSQIADADTITNIDLSSLYNGNWSSEINGAAIQTGAESVTGNAGSGLSFSDPTGAYVNIFATPITISPPSIALTSSSVVNGLFNNFFGNTSDQGDITFTNNLGQTATFSLIGGQTVRDYNNDGFVNTITGSNSDPAADGDVTAQNWWFDESGGTNPGTPGSPSSRLDAQTFLLPSSWDGTDLTSIEITDPNGTTGCFGCGELVLSALQVDAETPVTGVPEPASITLLSAALIGFGAIRRRRKVA